MSIHQSRSVEVVTEIRSFTSDRALADHHEKPSCCPSLRQIRQASSRGQSGRHLPQTSGAGKSDSTEPLAQFMSRLPTGSGIDVGDYGDFVKGVAEGIGEGLGLDKALGFKDEPSDPMLEDVGEIFGHKLADVLKQFGGGAKADGAGKGAEVGKGADGAKGADKSTGGGAKATKDISQKGIDMIERYEGFRSKAYQDSGGVWTIGYGHTGNVKAGDTVTKAQAEKLLRKDLDQAVDSVESKVKVPLTQDQKDALVSFEFNTGGLGESTLLRKLNGGDYAGAQKEFGRWVHDSKGHRLDGLVKRRAEEAKLFGSKAPSDRAAGNDSANGADKPAKPDADKPSDAGKTGSDKTPTTTQGYVDRFLKHADAKAKAEFERGEKVVLALRTDTSTRANGGQGKYDDTIVVLDKQRDGSVKATKFEGNVDPAGKYEARGYGHDIDGDGRKELGRLVEGTYHYELAGGEFAGDRYFRTGESQTALRDVNHDGRFTSADMKDSKHVGDTMYIHQGGTSTTGSAGCQTMRPDDYQKFLGLMVPEKSFSYVLA